MSKQPGEVGQRVNGVDYYELLGVRRGASTAEIKSAYRALAKTMHPDAGGTTGTFRMLQRAYETLNDPQLRADYDRDRGEPEPPVATRPRSGAWTRARAKRSSFRFMRERAAREGREFGEDPDFQPEAPDVQPEEILWWVAVDPEEPVRLTPARGPDRRASAGLGASWALLVLFGVVVSLPPALFTVWLVLVLAGGGVVLVLARRIMTAQRVDRVFRASYGDQRVFGEVGDDEESPGRHITGDLLSDFLIRIPGVRVFHGLSTPGSVFVDVDHAVLCGRRLVLIESKSWLPGRYSMAQDGTPWRNGHRFRGGATHLSEHVAAFQDWLPDMSVCGVVVLYPSRFGEITCEDGMGATLAMLTSERLVDDLGAWLLAEPAVLDRDVFRAVLERVVEPVDDPL